MGYTTKSPSGLRSIDTGATDWLTNYNYNIQRLYNTLLKITNLGDVDDASIVDTNVLRYNAASGKWEPAAATKSPIDSYDWYVSGSGVDTPSGGSRAAPFRTIQYAHDQASPNDSICITEGTYAETVTVTKSGLSFVAPKLDAVITGGGTRTYGFYSYGTYDSITIDGISITACRYGIYSRTTTSWTIKNCKIYDLVKVGTPPSGDEFIGIWMITAGSIIIEDNQIYRVLGGADGHGIKLESSSGMIDGNECSAISGSGIYVTDNLSVASTIQNNICYHCENGIELENTAAYTVTNNRQYMCRNGVKADRTKFNTAGWTNVTYDTAQWSEHAGVMIGNIDLPNTGYLNVRHNLLLRSGYTSIWYGTTLAGAFDCDYNMHYANPPSVTYDANGVPTVLRYPLLYWYGFGILPTLCYDLDDIHTAYASEGYEEHSEEFDGSTTGYGATGLPAVTTTPKFRPYLSSTVTSVSSGTVEGAQKLLRWKWNDPPFRTAEGSSTAWVTVQIEFDASAVAWRYVLLTNWYRTGSQPWVPKNIRIRKSDDEIEWTDVYSGTMSQAWHCQFIDCGAQTSVYVRLYVDSNYWTAAYPTVQNYVALSSFLVGTIS